MFLTQGWNLHLLHCRQILYLLSYQGSPYILLVIDIWVASNCWLVRINFLSLWSKGWITLICTATRQEMLSFLNISKWLSSMYVHIYASCCWAVFSCVWLFATPWTVACQAPLFMRFPRQEYCSGLPFPTIVFMHTCLKIIISSELALTIRIISVVL